MTTEEALRWCQDYEVCIQYGNYKNEGRQYHIFWPNNLKSGVVDLHGSLGHGDTLEEAVTQAKEEIPKRLQERLKRYV